VQLCARVAAEYSTIMCVALRSFRLAHTCVQLAAMARQEAPRAANYALSRAMAINVAGRSALHDVGKTPHASVQQATPTSNTGSFSGTVTCTASVTPQELLWVRVSRTNRR